MHTLSTRGNQQQQALLGMTHLGSVQRHPLPQWHAKKVNQAWLQQCSKLKGERARKWQGACEAVRKTLITPYKYFQAFFFLCCCLSQTTAKKMMSSEVVQTVETNQDTKG